MVRKKKRTPTRRQTAPKTKPAPSPVVVTAQDLSRVEFHRNAFALMPETDDRAPGVAMMVAGSGAETLHRSCTCSVSGSRTCAHLLKLSAILKGGPENSGAPSSWPDTFRESPWHALAAFMAEDRREKPEAVTLGWVEAGASASWVAVLDGNGAKIMEYRGRGPDRSRFVERCGPPPKKRDRVCRGGVLAKLALLTLTESERVMLDRGYRTRGMAFQETFWYKAAYHCFREFGPDGARFFPSIEQTTGAFGITCRDALGETVLCFTLDRKRVKRFLAVFAEQMANDHGPAVHPIPLEWVFDVRMTRNQDLAVTPQLRLIRKNGEFSLLNGIDMKRFRYGDLVYIPQLNLLADMVDTGPESVDLSTLATTILQRSQIPVFVETHQDELATGRFRVDPSVRGLKILRRHDRVDVRADPIDRDWCWLSVDYGFGSATVALAEILEARKTGQRFIGTPEGWVDCNAADLDGLAALRDLDTGADASAEHPGLRLSKMDVVRMHAVNRVSWETAGPARMNPWIRRLLDGQPSTPLPEVRGLLTSGLRDYQQQGVRWLWYLVENGFGGLLCDDMGLGKTHQIMALFTCLLQDRGPGGAFLVVCPTTVLSHWLDKIAVHAPALSAAAYHGPDRNLTEITAEHNVVVTSYGVLLRDIGVLRSTPFSVAVFDEIQHVKNPQTQAYRAAAQVAAPVKLGLTGTPIENRLQDLKSLMDLTVPGYLMPDAAFQKRYADEIEPDLQSPRRTELRRLIAPFTLRRLKSSVLAELPEKIEDVRHCRLSDEQVKRYRDAIEGRRQGVIAKLADPGGSIPYIHVFALLTLLKQICDHPALVNGGSQADAAMASGKWDLFQELLNESLDSGQKVVVYSQFLGMIDIIRRYLDRLGIGHVTLTGQSRDRGKTIHRFNTDPDCRVFVGSLRAGGIGIDLVAASVVIHYDRWWNAAKEDQATDRVHRIGQTRGVQVFKLVTEGTLEEKISAIIARKKDLMNSVVPEDDPGVLKTFSREELLEMLALPPAGGDG